MNRKLLCFIWIASALVLGGLLWGGTQSFRMKLLTDDVNKVLAVNGGGRIGAPPVFSDGPASVLGGSWFTVDNASGTAGEAFVFTLIRNGISAACVAMIDEGGKVSTIIPLSGSARQLTGELPPPVYRFYASRIEEAVRKRNAAMGGSR